MRRPLNHPIVSLLKQHQIIWPIVCVCSQFFRFHLLVYFYLLLCLFYTRTFIYQICFMFIISIIILKMGSFFPCSIINVLEGPVWTAHIPPVAGHFSTQAFSKQVSAIAFASTNPPLRGIGSDNLDRLPIKKPSTRLSYLIGGPSGTRTHDTLLKRQVL